MIESIATITTGGVSQRLFPATQGRRTGWHFRNNSQGSLWLREGSTATLALPAIEVKPGGSYKTPRDYRGVSPIYVIGSDTGQAYTARMHFESNSITTTVKATEVIQYLRGRINGLNNLDAAPMSTPPVMTIGADYAGSTVSGSVFIPIIDTRILKTRDMNVSYNTAGRNVYQTYTSSAGVGCAITFVTDADVFEIDVQAQPTFATQMLIDGVRANDTGYSVTVASGNVRKVIKFTMGSRKVREYTIFANYNIAGLFIHPKYQLIPVQSSKINMFYIGDSYSTGGYYGFPSGHEQDLTEAVGWRAIAGSGVGGSGYKKGSVVFLERLKAQVDSENPPSVLATFGGLNDATGLILSEVVSSIDDYYTYVEKTLPHALVISVGPYAPQATQVTTQPGYKAVNDALKERLERSSLSYIYLDALRGSILTSWGTVFDGSQFDINNNEDNNPNAVFTGSGNVTGSGAGNTYLYISADSTHPTTASAAVVAGLPGTASGIAYLSKWVYHCVKSAINAYPGAL
jgi:hypothetical protein